MAATQQARPAARRRGRALRIIGAAGLAALAAAALAGCSSGHSGSGFAPVAAPRIGLTIGSASKAVVKIGVVYTGVAAAEGNQDAELAAGALVAAYRINHGAGPQVDLIAVDDLGTADGGAAAAQTLLADGVVGVVYASSGAHIAAGVDAARAAGVAVLAPYDDGSGLAQNPPPAGVWLTGPTLAQVVTAINAELASGGYVDPVVISAATLPDSLSALAPGASRMVLNADTVAGGVAPAPAPSGQSKSDRASALGQLATADAVVVWGDAAEQSALVQRLQQANSPAAIVLSPDALSPMFNANLRKAARNGDATTAGVFRTVGEPVSDYTTTDNAAAFMLALNAMAADPAAMALNGVDSFRSAGADGADTRGYDAVLALAAAAAKAADSGDGSAGAVSRQLSAMKAGAGQGLVGPTLDFTRADALAGAKLAVLQATPQPGGHRPVPLVAGQQNSNAATLSWYVLGVDQ
ncbi:MAG: hypothetical protein FWD74_12095 [Actinomycetia bacterium]|nr:hypothetical protein [Actinomycetes bacterium]